MYLECTTSTALMRCLSQILDERVLNPQKRFNPHMHQPQSNFKKIALAPHDFAGNFYLI